MRQRNVAVSIILTLVTCGIYGYYWLVCLTDDATEVTGTGERSGRMALVFSIVTCNIYLIYWSYKMGEKLDMARAQRNIPTGNLSIAYLLLTLFGLGIVTFALIQSELNKYTPTGDDF